MTCMHMCAAVCLHVRMLIRFICQFQKGHVLRTVFTCRRCHQQRTWSSSRVLSGHYLVNQKYVACLYIASVFNYSSCCYLTFTGWSVLSLVLVCCPPSTSTSPLSLVLVLLAMAILHKVAYGVRICIVSISIDLFFSV